MSVHNLSRRSPTAFLPVGGGFATARVEAVDETGERVDLGENGQTRAALVSLGCLIRPQPGNSVLVFHDGEDAFVVQVLRRDGAGPATLALPGRGALAVEGDSIRLAARRRLSLAGDRLDLHGRSLALVAETTTWVGQVLTGVVDRFRMSARSHETHAETLVEKAGDRAAIVGGTDSVRAETRVVTVTGVASETAQSKVVAVADDLRMDGKRITMG